MQIGIGSTVAHMSAGAAFSPSDIANLEGWIAADQSDITLSGSDITSMANMGSLGGTFGSGGFPPALITRGGGLAIEYAAADERLVSSLAASSWNFMNQGTGMTIAMVFECAAGTGSSYLIDTRRAGNGVQVRYDASANERVTLSSVDSSTTYINSPSSVGTYPDDTQHVFDWVYAEGRSPAEYQATKNGVETNTGDTGGTPAGGDPAYTLWIGRLAANGANAGLQYVREVCIYSRALTDTERASLRTYLARW